VAEILFTFTARNLLEQTSFPKPSPTICFYLKAMRGKPSKINLECNVLSRFGSVQAEHPRFKQTELKEDRGASPLYYLNPQQRSASAFLKKTLGQFVLDGGFGFSDWQCNPNDMRRGVRRLWP